MAWGEDAKRSARFIPSRTYSVTSRYSCAFRPRACSCRCRGPAFREEGRAVELEELSLDEAPHEVRRVRHVDAVPETALEPVRAQEGHEELEVLFLSVARGGREEEQVAGEPAQARLHRECIRGGRTGSIK